MRVPAVQRGDSSPTSATVARTAAAITTTIVWTLAPFRSGSTIASWRTGKGERSDTASPPDTRATFEPTRSPALSDRRSGVTRQERQRLLIEFLYALVKRRVRTP